MAASPSEHEIIDAFRTAMAAGGVPYSGPIEPDGEFHRIQVDGDKRGRKNGWYKCWADDRPNGIFGSFKGLSSKWSPERTVVLTPEERAKLHARSEQQRAERAAAKAAQEAEAAAKALAMWETARPVTEHMYLTRKGVPAYGLRAGDWIKEKDGEPYTAAKGALLVPVMDGRTIVGLQAIFAAPIRVAGDLRDKDFVRHARKKGCYFPICGEERPSPAFEGWIQLCEGYATGASLFRATGFITVVCFDASNLVAVAERLRALMPKAKFIVCGDNDAFTFKPDKVTPWNPGREFAEEAAKKCAGLCVLPSFRDLDGKPTDFNDLDTREGRDAVRAQVMAAIDPTGDAPPLPESAPEGPFAPEDGVWEPIDPDDNGQIPPEAAEDDRNTEGFFRILGHDRENIYIYQYKMKLILARGMASWPVSALIMLAPLQWWEREFPKGREGGIQLDMALNWLVRSAEEKGFFDPNCRRGRGAWRDADRLVYHFGDRLMVDGAMRPDLRIDSTNVYEQAGRLRHPADEALSAADGRRIVRTAQLFHWTRPASAILWAGWVALAPVCGALLWRPHIWITGGAGSGKSTVLGVAHWLLNGNNVYAQGNSTEAGIRQTLRIDSLPVLFDESEKNTDREALRVDAILSMIRQSSTESAAKTIKGTQSGGAMDFIIRSMFCLSSIQVGMKQQADFERVSILKLRPTRHEGSPDEKSHAAENWRVINGGIHALKADETLPARLLRRSIAFLPTTLRNIEVFSQAAAEYFGSQRDGDQYGALVAGAWSLVKDRVAALDEARAMIGRYDWEEHHEHAKSDASRKALDALLQRSIRLGSVDVTTGDLIAIMKGSQVEGLTIGKVEAKRALKNHGYRVEFHPKKYTAEEGSLWVACSNVERDLLFRETPHLAGEGLYALLVDLPNAEKRDNQRFSGPAQRFVSIPLSFVFGSDCPAPAAADVDDDLSF